jgi:hypothetical protein
VKRSLLQGEEGKKKNEEEMGGGSYSRHENARHNRLEEIVIEQISMEKNC